MHFLLTVLLLLSPPDWLSMGAAVLVPVSRPDCHPTPLTMVFPTPLNHLAGLIHQLFVMATSVNFTGPLLLGIVLDAYGPRACSIISIALVMGGFILFGISNDTFYAYVPAIMMIAFGGPGVQSSIIHLSNLYPTRKATVTSVITG